MVCNEVEQKVNNYGEENTVNSEEMGGVGAKGECVRVGGREIFQIVRVILVNSQDKGGAWLVNSQYYSLALKI